VSSRWPDLVRLLLATLLEALWFGALAALLVAAPPAPVILLCWAVAAGAAFLAAAARDAAVAPGAAPAPVRHRVLLLALGLAVAAGLIAAASPEGLEEMVWTVVRSAVFVGVSLELGLLAGRAEIDPERAFRRAARAFALVFVLVLVSYAAGEPLAGSGILVAVAVLAGLALVAVARALVTLRAIEGRRSLWRWTAGVVVAGLLALALAALVAALPAGGALAWLGGLVIAALQGLLDVVGYVIAGAGYLIMRALVVLAGILHLHPDLPEIKPPSTAPFKAIREPPGRPRSGVPEVLAVVFLVVLALVAVRLLLRSFRVERDGADEAAVEEREQLVRPVAEMRAAGRRLARRLSRLVGGGRPRTPAEALRAEYCRLERTLGKSGYGREASWSVRRYLGSLPGAPQEGDPDGAAGGRPAGRADRATVARLVELYERARYADAEGGIGWPEVEDFKRARRALLTAASY